MITVDMKYQFSHFKKEPDAEDLWAEFRQNFEQGQLLANERNALAGAIGAFDKINPSWVPKQEEKFLLEAEMNY